MRSPKYSYLFINDELLKMLNELGYTHFYTKEQVDSFEHNRAFYYCVDRKEYGYVDVVPNIEVKNIKENEDYLRSQLKEKNK